MINRGSACLGTYMGYASYIGTNTKLANTYIGKFTSIASDVMIIYGNHPSKEFVSTHNAFCFKNGYSICYMSEEHCFPEEKIIPYADKEKILYVL